MSDSVLDTPYESALRTLLILRATGTAVSAAYLAALDTLTVNGQTFGLQTANLNGMHRFAAGEYYARHRLIQTALRSLALKELVEVSIAEKTVKYSLTEAGNRTANRMMTRYAREFFGLAIDALEQLDDLNEDQVIDYATTRSLQEGTP